MEIAARERSIAQLQSRLDAEIELRRGQDAAMASRDSELERVKAEANKWRLRVPKLVATIKAHDATLTAHSLAAGGTRCGTGRARRAGRRTPDDHRGA